MPRKVVCAKLVFGIVAILLQIGGPFLQEWPVALRKRGVALYLCQGRNEQQHIGRLLNHHLAIERLFATAINLSRCMWIPAQVVRGKVKFPAARTGVVKDW